MADSMSSFGVPDTSSLSRPSLFPEAPSFGLSSSPAADLSKLQTYREGAPLIDGTRVPLNELAADEYGAKLVAIRGRKSRYGFLDALTEGSLWDFVPFFGMFATAGNSIAAARDASNAFQKMQRGEPLTRDEAIRATLWREEQDMRADGTWGAMFGEIVRKAPAFMVEMGGLGSAGQVVRSRLASSAVRQAGQEMTSAAVDKVVSRAVTRAVKTGAAEYADDIVSSTIRGELAKGVYSNAAAAAQELAKSPEFLKSATTYVTTGVRRAMDMSAPELTRVSQWAPGLANKAAQALAERAVKAKLAHDSLTSAWSRWFSSAGQAVKDSFIEGLVDLGAWGSDTASTLTTGLSSASRAVGHAALDFTVFAGTRGAAMFAAREAAVWPAELAVEAVTGSKPVRENTLNLQQAAWQNKDPDLMDRAEAYGMFLDLLEYVSENTGRGFTNLMRGAGLAAGVARPATRVAGYVDMNAAPRVTRDAAGKIVDVAVSAGLVESQNMAQAGGMVSRYIEKVFGNRALRDNVLQDKVTAVAERLRNAGLDVGDLSALRTTIETKVPARGLAPEIAEALGPNIDAYVKSAVKEANHQHLMGRKIHGYILFRIADFAQQHNFDARQVYDAFKTMGYDGIMAEMAEERYSDFVKELFGLDAQHKDLWDRMATAVQRLFWPEKGFKQLIAEALGFAVPGVVRAGAARTLAAVGDPNDYANQGIWSANYGDLLRYGTLKEFKRGDYLASMKSQEDRLRTAAEKQQEILDRGTQNGVPLTPRQKSDLTASKEGYERGALRASKLRSMFLASLGAEPEVYMAPVYTDAQLTAPDAEFEQRLHATAEQAKRGMDAYRSLINFAPKVGQLQYKARHKTPEESAGWFRKAAHWVAEHAARAAGFAATGEIAFLSSNAAQWAMVDKGADPHLLAVLHDGYAKVFQTVVKNMRTESRSDTVDLDAAHAAALEQFRNQAEAIVAEHLAAMNVFVFSHDELADMALAKVAEDDGYVVDARGRQVVGTDLKPISYQDFLSREGVQARVDEWVKKEMQPVFDLLTSTRSERADAALMSFDLDRSVEGALLRQIARIPKDLPTASQAVLASVLRYHPSMQGTDSGAYRRIMEEKAIERDVPLADQLVGSSARAGVLQAISDSVLEGRDITSLEDFNKVVAESDQKVDAGVLEIVGRDLGYMHDFTEKGLRDRNRRIVRYALQASVLKNSNIQVFSRSANIAEVGQRFASLGEDVVVATRTASGWTGTFHRASTNEAVVVTAPTREALAEIVTGDEYGYHTREQRVIHTPVTVLYSDSALDFIFALNHGRTYRERMDRVFTETEDENLKDPFYRKNADGSWRYDEEEANRVRQEEAAEAEMYEARGGQTGTDNAVLYLAQGESAEDEAAMKVAQERMQRARVSWMRRELRDKNGRALGYNAVAEDLANSLGVRGGAHSRLEQVFGLADPGLHGKFVMSLNAFSRETGGDIYISIDHGTAQSYSASILTAAVNSSLARNGRRLRRGFSSYVKGFLVEVEHLVTDRIANAKAAGDAEAENRWRAFGEWSVMGVADGSRRVSLDTLGKFIQAFCLYRTNVPANELGSTLGEYASELADIANEARSLASYKSFCMAADLALDGSGFDVTSAPARGLTYYYNRFAPNTESLKEAVAKTLPEGMTYEDFVADVRARARVALRATRGDRVRDVPPGTSVVDELAARIPEDPPAIVETIRAVVEEVAGEEPLSPKEKEVMALALGGEANESISTPPVATETPETAEEGGEGPASDNEESTDDVIEYDEPEFDVQPLLSVDDEGNRITADYHEVKNLTDDEVAAFGANIVRLLGAIEFTTPTSDGTPREDARALLKRLAPGMSDEEINRVVAVVTASDGSYVGDVNWVFADEPDEEALTPDGYDLSGSRNVEVLKSPIMRRLIALLSRVSPATGRDFQPCVEDLRSFVPAIRNVHPELLESRPVLRDAVSYMERLLNPRANNQMPNASLREAAHADLVEWMRPPAKGAGVNSPESLHWTMMQAYLSEFVGAAGTEPVCARAAVFLAYLMSLPSQARIQLLQFVASSAPAQPVRLQTVIKDQHTQFKLEAVHPRPGRVSLEALTSVLARFAGRAPSDLVDAADQIEHAFADEIERAVKESWSANLKSGVSILQRNSGHGLFDVYARVFGRVLGMDNPVTVAFASRRFAVSLATDPGKRSRVLNKFVVPDAGTLPYAVTDFTSAMRSIAAASKDKPVDAALLQQATISLFRSGAPADRHIHRANASAMGSGAWAMLIGGYSDAKPVSVMRAVIDEERTNKPASSLSITMPGVEPVLQQFLDREGPDGFLGVCQKFFPDRVKTRGFDLGVLRQRMTWPDREGTAIVAKNIVKTAQATEVLAGARSVYEDKDSEMLYVPLYSGDHSSSIIIQAPIAKALRGAKMDYDSAALMVSRWLGLDLFGVDAKRSALTCLEAPGFSLIGIRKDAAGDYIFDDQGKAQTGTLHYSVLWNAQPGANNEAFLGTVELYGYGALRARQMARDPKLSACKLHIAAVGESPVFGAVPELTKSLVTAQFGSVADTYGQFLEGDPKRTIMDYAARLVGNDRESSALVTDYDSVKMDVINSKMIGVLSGDKVKTIMEFVLDQVLRSHLDKGRSVGDGIRGDDLDRLAADTLRDGADPDTDAHLAQGLIPFVNQAKGGAVEWHRLSEVIPGAAILHVDGDLYTFDREVSNLMAFQVANVAHQAKPETGPAARNYMMDAAAVAVVLEGHNADTVAGTNIFEGRARVTGSVRQLISSYGLLAAAITSDEKSIDLALEQDEEWQALKAAQMPTTGRLAQSLRRKLYSAWVKDVRTAPMHGIPAALVSSGTWVDPTTGGLGSHSTNAMYNDVMRGARSIPKSQREFYGAAKRVALCNVNCVEMSFRHGMYIDAEGLLADKQLGQLGFIPEKSGKTTDEQRVVLAMENIITAIATGCTKYGNTPQECAESERSLRFLLGQYLLDHTGTKLSDRFYIKKSGDVVYFAEAVGYLDLFTQARSATGGFLFDRAAIYTGMHDSEGKVRMYLGGTAFGFSRTPSGNGQIQIVRAGLPVNVVTREYELEGGGSSTQWASGVDAAVAADPYSLKILGNDNDGDKSFLYMLHQYDKHLVGADGNSFCFTYDDLEKLFGSLDLGGDLDQIAADMFDVDEEEGDGVARAKERLVEWRRSLVASGVLARERKRRKRPDGTVAIEEGRLGLSPRSQARLSNTLVLAMMDLNRMLPVYDMTERQMVLYSGTVADGSRPGDMYRGVKAAPAPNLYKSDDPEMDIPEKTHSPEGAWDVTKAKPGVMAPAVLDINDPAKRIANVSTAMKVQTGGNLVAAARARFVAATRNLHVLWFTGTHAGLNTEDLNPVKFIDMLYHMDGPSNMSFDDMKEQVCSRLGLLPGMIDTFLAEYVYWGNPMTDAQANAAFARYAQAVNDPTHMYHWMMRASNTADTEAHDEFVLHGHIIGEKEQDPVENALVRYTDPLTGKSLRVEQVQRLVEFLSDNQPGTPNAGIREWLYHQQDVSSAVSQFIEWYQATRDLSAANTMAKAMNYTYVDPGERTTDASRERLQEVFLRDDAPMSREARRMGAAVQLLLAGTGDNALAHGTRSIAGFKGNFRRALADPQVRPGSYEAQLLAGASVAPRLKESQKLQAANNARMVMNAVAAFALPRQIEGSVFNDGDGYANLYRKSSALAEAVSVIRHPVLSRKSKGPQVRPNVSLDFCWAVESMVDLLCRFTASSTVHRHLPISDYFKEVPSATSNALSPEKYGPAAMGAAHVSLALPDMSREQLLRLQELTDQVVRARVLDPDGELGRTPWTSITGGKPYQPASKISFAFSVENMKKMLAFSRSQNRPGFKQELNVSSLAEGKARNVTQTLEVLIKVFEELSKKYPKDFPPGFEIRPSALFGQLLPAYAAMTDYVDGAPGPESRSLLMAFPEDLALQEYLVSKLDKDDKTAGLGSLLEAIDWGPSTGFSDFAGQRTLRAVTPRSVLAQSAGSAFRILQSMPQGTPAWKALKGTPLSEYQPGSVTTGTTSAPRRMLNVFDGAKGVAFEAMTHIARLAPGSSQDKMPVEAFTPALAITPEAAGAQATSAPRLRLATGTSTLRVAGTAPSTTPRLRPPTRSVSPARPVVQAAPVSKDTIMTIAQRMGQVFKMWSNSKVKFNPSGDGFVIESDLVVNKDDPSAKLFKTRINVRVTDGGITPELQSAGLIASLAAEVGVDEAELKAHPEKVAELMKTHHVGGFTTFQFNDAPGSFRVSTRDLEVLTADVVLDAEAALQQGSAFHEAFHAIVGFARATGVLTDEDIAALARKYKGGRRKGWFNEEKAARDYQKIMQGVVDASRDEGPTGILGKLFAFIKSLVHALGDIVRHHTSEDYVAQGAHNPLTGLVFTGEVYSSEKGEQRIKIMDRDARIRYALTLAHPNATDEQIDARAPLFYKMSDDDPRLVKLLTEYGGEVLTSKPETTQAKALADAVPGTAYVAPNAKYDSDIVRVEPNEDDFEMTDELDALLDVQPIVPAVRKALADVGLGRMAVPYGEMDQLASAIGAAIRDGFSAAAVDDIRRLAPEPAAALQSSQIRRMREAIQNLSHLYGKSPNVSAEQEKLLFRGMYELAARGYAFRDTSRQHGPVADHAKSKTSRANLTAAVAVASGVRPGDILEAALYDLREIRKARLERSADDSLVKNVLDRKLIPTLEHLYGMSADPTELLAVFAPAAAEGPTRSNPHDVFAYLSDGTQVLKDADGYRTGYSVGGQSNSPYFADNVRHYKDHEADPDFQRALGIALDAIYTVAAARSLYQDLGVRPGGPADALAMGDLLTPAEMAADLSATPEQYDDPAFSAVGFEDEGWVSTAAPQMWLDSMVRPYFGAVSLRDATQTAHRSVAGYQLRISSLRNMHAFEYGMNGSPGDALLAVDDNYDSGFSWQDSHIVSGPREGARYKDIRRYHNLDRVYAKDGQTHELIRMTKDDLRRVDLLLKARFAYLTGARKLVTGVNDLTFSIDDSADEGYYSREAVERRVQAGRAGGESDFDVALHRLDIQLRDSYGDHFDWITESGTGQYGLRDRLIAEACDALRAAKSYVEAGRMSRDAVNDFVIAWLDKAGLVNGVQHYVQGQQGKRFTSAAVALDVDAIEDLFLQSDTYKKLLKAGRRAEWLTRDTYLKPYADLVREVRAFTRASPFLSEGVGRFFQSASSIVPFAQGQGVTLYRLSRKAERNRAEVASKVRTSFADAFEQNIDRTGVPAAKADDNVLLMMCTMFHLPADDVETIRRKVAAGDFAQVPGLELTADSSVADIVRAVAERLDSMVFNAGEDTSDASAFGGMDTVKTLVERYHSREVEGNDPVPNVAGLAHDVVHRITGRLPANYQTGHAVQNMIDGLTNALSYRAALVNMVTTPDAEGMPLCYIKPALDAENTTGLPDAVWGAVARWWGELHGLEYDGMKSGVENVRAMYDEIIEHDRIDKSQFGSINPESMDDRTIKGFWARKGVPDGESQIDRIVGGYALGYAKHLFWSTKGLGSKWQRAIIHRSWAYSKAMSVSFSLFFPIATRIESPIGAVGLMATLGGNISAKTVRKFAKALNKIFNALGNEWITKEFLGEQDFAQMLDSNDPFLADMYRYAGALGLTMSTSSVNPEEHSRGILMEDLRNLTEFVRGHLGDKAAKKVADISGSLLTRASEKAFTYHLNATKLAVAAQLCMKLQHDAAERGIAFDPVRDLRRYASYINAEIGGIDPLQYAWAHPGMQNLLNSVFFSWQWTRGAWEAGGGKIIEQVLFGGHDVTPEERKYILGRALRMYGWIAFGLPMLAQALIKAIAWGIDPDHELREDEPWWTFQNEEKTYLKYFDLTPVMRAIAKRFPAYAEWRGNHPVLAGIPNAAFMLTKSPWLLPTVLPVYTGSDPRNTTGGKHYYMRFGKQVWEFNGWFDHFFTQLGSKLAMPIQRVTEGVLGRSITWMDHPLPWYKMGDAERWLSPTKDSALVNLVKAFLPFSLSGLTDLGDAGMLPMLGPVVMGAGAQETLDRLKDDMNAWVSNDRGGYAFGGRRGRMLKRFKSMVRENQIAWRYISELMQNGYTERQASAMIDRAIGDLAGARYRKLEDLLPDTPDGEYDTETWAKTARELQRLGVTRKALYKALVRRLEMSGKWRKHANQEDRRGLRNAVRQFYTDPYLIQGFSY